LEHADIDLIFNGSPVYYVDDSEIAEEQCFGRLPFPEDYFEKNFIVRKFGGVDVKLPSFNFQIAVKIIGELRKDFTVRAQRQMSLLFDNYVDFDERKAFDEIRYIFERTTPKTLNHSSVAREVVKAIVFWKAGYQKKAMDKMSDVHSEVNLKLREEFAKRGIDKKGKISEVDV
jgi:hypothetical protein